MVTRTVVVLDIGGANVKAGIAGQSQPTSCFPNASAKVKGERSTLMGDQILDCGDISAITLRRPVDRGFVVNWDLEKTIWDRTFRSVLGVRPKECGLVLTEPFFNLPAIQNLTDQVVFEDFGFQSYLPTPASLLSLRNFAQQQPKIPANRAFCGLVVDAGFSFTHVAPIFDGHVLLEGVRRINLGGKALTNYLKELVSFRSINMMEETYLVEHIKEAACFVSRDLASDLVAAKAGRHRCEYVLPDGVSNLRGFLREPVGPLPKQSKAAAGSKDQPPVLQLNNERFMVPELVFHPSDVALDQASLAQTVLEATNAVHPDLRPLLLSNVVCTGGTARCPGFSARLFSDLRPLVPIEYEVAVHMPADPVLCAWQGGSLLGASHEYERIAFTRADYEERGSAHMRGS